MPVARLAPLAQTMGADMSRRRLLDFKPKLCDLLIQGVSQRLERWLLLVQAAECPCRTLDDTEHFFTDSLNTIDICYRNVEVVTCGI